MEMYNPASAIQTPYVFFTGKGGVGKTSAACATAVCLAEQGKKVLLVSTDPASNLQDVFSLPLNGTGTPIPDVPGLFAANLDPIEAAAVYRESVLAPYRGILPQSALENMAEQLSGSCTVEIAAFNAFSDFITSPAIRAQYDTVLFDTAPTGHTLRLLQLPSAWSGFIRTSTHGASCLGQLSGLEEKKAAYQRTVATLASPAQTTLVLVTRPEDAPLREAARASGELSALGIQNQLLVVNGLLETHTDPLSDTLWARQRASIKEIPLSLSSLPTYFIPLRAFNITGLANVRALLAGGAPDTGRKTPEARTALRVDDLVQDAEKTGKKVIFTMGKGGVGKTSIAAAVALGLAHRGNRVLLTTTDPAADLLQVVQGEANLTVSRIDEKAELEKYRSEVVAKAKENGLSAADIAYIEEDLRSPCTQEIAVFRAFAEVVAQADDRIVVIDTAPTGHTLLLLESTASYDRELRRTHGQTPAAVQQLLPRLKSSETEVLIVTLPEATPVYEALRLEEDLHRAGIPVGWWVVNRSFYRSAPADPLLCAKANAEVPWIDRVARHAGGRFVLVGWQPEPPRRDRLLQL